MSENQKQREYWNSVVGENWTARQENFDRGFTHITAALMEAAALKPGMNVLDVGSGAGSTTLAIAKAVAPGRAVGVDISAAMVAAAKARAHKADSPAEFVEADVSDHPFAAEFDLAVSRFGVMFFADPARSFAAIRKALRPDGRLVFVCWCPFEEVETIYAAYSAARDLLPPEEPVTPGAPGPFGLCDAARTQSILTDAGYSDTRIEKLVRPSPMGMTAEEAVEQAMSLGPLAFATRNSDDAAKAAVRARIRPALARYMTAEGVAPPAAFWLVTASA